MAPRAKRRKRDSVPNLYAQCQITGNCPPDVRNKVEGTTLADQLLKVFGSLVYFGGLGIGTGKGTGGTGGYRPLPEGGGGGRVQPGGTVTRPSVALDPLGPPDIVSVDPLAPNAPSVVPLSEGDPGIVVPEGGVGGGTEPTIPNQEVTVSTPLDPVSDVTNSGGGVSVTTTEDSVAILDVQPTAAPKRVVTKSVFQNPAYTSLFSADIVPGDPSNTSEVLVNTAVGGTNVGEGEFIELDIFGPEEFEIAEDAPRTSTPSGTLSRALSKARELYNRRVKQVVTRNPDFLGSAGRAVTFQFENPAFSDEVSVEFARDLQGVAAAPDPDFNDVVYLSRPHYSETAEGVRVSRLARKGTIITRSGLQIGEAVHFYYDVSSIPVEDVELDVLGEHSGESVLVDAQNESSFVNLAGSDNPLLANFDEGDLLDAYTEDFSNSHLILSSNRANDTLTIPTLPPGVGLRVFIDDVGEGLFVSHPVSANTRQQIPLDTSDRRPDILHVPFMSDDYFLHPSLHKRKRKRNF